jgi:acyl-CoA synthetase (AMP-forming)/AMP-acid ligase II
MLLTSACRAACKPFSRSFKAFPIPLSRYPQFYRMASTLPNLAIFNAISKHDPASPAIIHGESQQSFSYGSLLQDVAAAKDHISRTANDSPLQGERIAFLAENSYDYVGMC